jgi:hypothetical protein
MNRRQRSYIIARLRVWLCGWRLLFHWSPSWDGPTWFNLDAPLVTLDTPYRFRVSLALWSIFNRRCADGSHYWGIGICKVNRRFLFAHMFSGTSILFVGCIP